MALTTHEPILEVANLEVSYSTRHGLVKAIRNVSFEIASGDSLGLVGESGCGKSTLAFAIMSHVARNASVTGGSIRFCGEDMVQKSVRSLNRIRGSRIAMIYQDPVAALNPSLLIGVQLCEVLTQHNAINRSEAWDACIAMLEKVNMPDPPAVMRRYRHQLSGGQLQRAVIAMALLANPALLVLDEPTTSLDVTVEAGILDLIDELRRELNLSILFISHNLGVISRIADQVAVMYSGELVEQGPVRDIFHNPQHPYTSALLKCVPSIGTGRQPWALHPIKGRVPTLHESAPGCIFEPRCDRAGDRCRKEHPEFHRAGENHDVRCFYAGTPTVAELATAQDAPGNGNVATGSNDIVLDVDDLKTYYRARGSSFGMSGGNRNRGIVKAVDGVSFKSRKVEIVGIVGESGCGKSTLAKCIAGLEPPDGGTMEFIGVDIARGVEKRPQELIKELQMIFQNPDSTLNPKRTVKDAIARPLKLFNTVPASEITGEVVRLLDAVKLGETYLDRLPRQLSGGEKQRVALARAFAGRPSLVLCDEPLSSLDVSVQTAVMKLLLEFQSRFKTTMLFISHDLGIVYQLSDMVAVMYLGRICEIGPTEALFSPPYHPYTEALLSAVPIPDPLLEQTRIRLSGSVPSALNPPTGCRFHTRCPRKIGSICEREPPPWRQIDDNHFIGCHIDMDELRAMQPVIGTIKSGVQVDR